MGRNRRKNRSRQALAQGNSGSNDTRGLRSIQPDAAQGNLLDLFHPDASRSAASHSDRFHSEGFSPNRSCFDGICPIGFSRGESRPGGSRPGGFSSEGFRPSGFGSDRFCPDDFLSFQVWTRPTPFDIFGQRICNVNMIFTEEGASNHPPPWEREHSFSDDCKEKNATNHQKEQESQENIAIVSRKEWKAKMPRHALDCRSKPFTTVFVNSINGNILCNASGEIQRMQAIQSHQMKFLDDIMSHFVVGNDCKIYEGRGWDHKGEDGSILNIDFILKSIEDLPSDGELDECKKIIREGVRLGKISRYYCLATKRNHKLYDELVSWDNFSPLSCPE